MSSNFMKYLERQGFSHRTVETYYSDAIYFIEWAEKNRIEAEYAEYNHILEYVKSLKQRRISQRTIQHYMGSLKHYFNWLIHAGVRGYNPMQHVNIKGVRRNILYTILSRQQLDGLYAMMGDVEEMEEEEKAASNGRFAPRASTALRNKVIVGLMVYQGLNTKDMGRIEVSHLDLRSGKVMVPQGRRNNERTLKLEACQMLDMMHYVSEYRGQIASKKPIETDKLILSTGKREDLRGLMESLMRKLTRAYPQSDECESDPGFGDNALVEEL